MLRQNYPVEMSRKEELDRRRTGIDDRPVEIDERHFEQLKTPPQYFSRF